MRKYPIDETLFDKIDCEWKAYFLGLLFADGHIAKNETYSRILLKEDDTYILEKLNNYIYGKGIRPLFHRPSVTWTCKKGKTHTDKPQYGLYITNKVITQKFIEYGCGPNKSLTLNFIKDGIVPNDLMHHFIRGVFDGDGCMSKNGLQAAFSVSNSFAERLRIFFCNIGIEFTQYRAGKISVLETYNIKRITCLYNYLYTQANMYLMRKKERFEKAIKNRLFSPENKTSKYFGIKFVSKKWRFKYTNKTKGSGVWYSEPFNTEDEAFRARLKTLSIPIPLFL